MRSSLRSSFPLLAIVSLLVAAPSAQSQTAAPAAASPTTAPATADKPPLKAEELEQLLAPIALYPDSLISQMLMASTYPLEIVQAERWTKQNKSLKGDALTAALETQDWDASVKSLVNFPDVLTMMSEKLELTIKIGDAFLAQQADVLATIQKLRSKAKSSGNLQSNEQQKVTVQPAPPQPVENSVTVQPAPTEVIVIESSSPDVVYVPQYNPTVVYGGWPYPSYPPAPYYPPGYVASNVVSFGVGVAVGAAWGYAWGNCNWGGNDVDIDVNRNTNINNNIDRSKYQQNIQNRSGSGQPGKGSFQHDASRRGGVPYRDSKTSQRYGGGSAQSAQARNPYRGQAEAGRQDIARGGADAYRGGTVGSANRGTPGSANRGSTPSAANRGSTPSRSSGGALSSGGSSGSSARNASQRGQSSRSSPSYSSSRSGSSARSSPSRSSSGGSRSAPRPTPQRSGGGARGGGRR